MAGDTSQTSRRRNSILRYDTEEVQGEGSWVEVKRITLGESKAIQQRSQKLAQKVAKMKAAAQREDDVEAFAAASVYEQEQGWRQGMELFVTKITAWNWVDDNGNPLPLPKDDASVIDELTDEEAMLLSSLISGDDEARKKRLSGSA